MQGFLGSRGPQVKSSCFSHVPTTSLPVPNSSRAILRGSQLAGITGTDTKKDSLPQVVIIVADSVSPLILLFIWTVSFCFCLGSKRTKGRYWFSRNGRIRGRYLLFMVTSFLCWITTPCHPSWKTVVRMIMVMMMMMMMMNKFYIPLCLSNRLLSWQGLPGEKGSGGGLGTRGEMVSCRCYKSWKNIYPLHYSQTHAAFVLFCFGTQGRARKSWRQGNHWSKRKQG